MISSFSGGAVLTWRSCPASLLSTSAVGSSLSRTSPKCSAQWASISSDIGNPPSLSPTRASVNPQNLPKTTLVTLYTFPCSPMLDATSAWLPKSSFNAHFTVLANLFTFLSASWYYYLRLSFSLLDLASTHCFFTSLVVLMGYQVSAVVYSFFFLCLEAKQVLLAWKYAVCPCSYLTLTSSLSDCR